MKEMQGCSNDPNEALVYRPIMLYPVLQEDWLTMLTKTIHDHSKTFITKDLVCLKAMSDSIPLFLLYVSSILRLLSAFSSYNTVQFQN